MGANYSTTANCVTIANCTKHTFSYVYVRTIKLTGKSYVVYTPDLQTRSYHSAKVCWELESAAISAKIHRFNRAKQGFTFTMVPSQILSFFAFIILEIGTGHKKKWYEKFLHVHRRNVVKEKKIAWCRSGFPLLLSSLSNFEFFFAFIIIEILTEH